MIIIRRSLRVGGGAFILAGYGSFSSLLPQMFILLPQMLKVLLLISVIGESDRPRLGIQPAKCLL